MLEPPTQTSPPYASGMTPPAHGLVTVMVRAGVDGVVRVGAVAVVVDVNADGTGVVGLDAAGDVGVEDMVKYVVERRRRSSRKISL